MGLFLPGRTKCSICNKVIVSAEEATGTPAFISNIADPLYWLSDASFHRVCFDSHPLAKQVSRRLKAQEEAHRSRLCSACLQKIDNPEDYFTLDYFTDDPHSPLYPLNLIKLHKKCIKNWSNRGLALIAIKELKKIGAYRGLGIDYMIDNLEGK